MLDYLRRCGSAQPAVLSFNAQAEAAVHRRPQGQFEVLVRHLIHRFFHNELLASDDETRRVIMICYAAALPGLLVALFLFPAYHPLPPNPSPRPFWLQVSDHYLYVTYSFVVMGIATVYEWDLLFPDLLDVFVLSVLPIPGRRLFFARVLALAIFLGLVLVGTGAFGTVLLPLVADLPHPLLRLLAHAIAVGCSGVFAAAAFLALQGILLTIVGERFFRRIGPFVQSASLMTLLTVLLLLPTLSHTLQQLLASSSSAVRFFPPFWYLGVYEWILAGRSAPPVFKQLATTGCVSLAGMLALVVVTYPLAYRRRVRQLIEGGTASASRSPLTKTVSRLLDYTILRQPAQRSTFYFVSQTVLRLQRHRVMLALYAGLAVSLVLADMLVLHVTPHQVYPALLPAGIRAALPVSIFWTVAALKAAVDSPVDRRGSWLFDAILGKPQRSHLAGTRRWITLWAIGIGAALALTLFALSPAGLQTRTVLAGQLIVCCGLSFVLADLFLFSTDAIPCTRVHTSAITDFPLALIKYVVLFPLLVAVTVRVETWAEANLQRLVNTALIFTALHLVLLFLRKRRLTELPDEGPGVETDDSFQLLGLTGG